MSFKKRKSTFKQKNYEIDPTGCRGVNQHTTATARLRLQLCTALAYIVLWCTEKGIIQ
jgi:hypothetical protein